MLQKYHYMFTPSNVGINMIYFLKKSLKLAVFIIILFLRLKEYLLRFKLVLKLKAFSRYVRLNLIGKINFWVNHIKSWKPSFG
jgi:hypothetical protein